MDENTGSEGAREEGGEQGTDFHTLASRVGQPTVFMDYWHVKEYTFIKVLIYLIVSRIKLSNYF